MEDAGHLGWAVVARWLAGLLPLCPILSRCSLLNCNRGRCSRGPCLLRLLQQEHTHESVTDLRGVSSDRKKGWLRVRQVMGLGH